ncbi:hypothetical protein AUJ40_01525 [Candidatus Berkelbacteria bacterium CG1_02_42_45]|uniref:HIT domain-containing protein n=3 Tax=Candidatus Berkelbacteria TaxID=1618330 RepID=A0A2M7K1Q6_9BACT|nr:MAG: hypothetical protein AUJ40_01525 [Candidatus Berkelbacteria bacterium CG1_02_42_45]PIR27074.1 MAG: hypothetical protein COV40_02865 [Candidatus Berkelbacteria bacterium CG11_big_fil_rev_8_21_14_0_20_42_15]PIX30192.1 MAG: hypothetical protein COZ63_01080 [Candidatus Berkelbacteria bacterium CG_4_8_14_3_um_filter_42_13]
MNDCIFCKIIRGEIPANKVYEDDKVLAFLDIKPVNPGHILIISKDHFADFLQAPDEIICQMTLATKKIGKKILASGLGEAITFTFNNGRAAGQVVDHVHLHVMPRKSGDGYELWHGKEYAPGEAEKIAEKLKIDL